MSGKEEQKKQHKSALNVMKGVEQPASINYGAVKKLRPQRLTQISFSEFLNGILSGDRTILGRAITLIESSLPEHQQLAQELIKKCLPYTGNSIRIGITGIPGVGKSTFIEALGCYLTSRGHKVAVLAIDPSSQRSKGSILGDKTRMSKLSADNNAFIRPSPSAGTLGGVARKTRETILLCEAAGYDIILVETIGVGQSETAVHSMVDFFLMLTIAGAGDELQGIKRGIMEMADMILINKSDDQTPEKIALTKNIYENALHLYPPTQSGWHPKVEYCSSKTLEGIENAWQRVLEYISLTKQNAFLEQKRKEQAKFWFYETLQTELHRKFFSDSAMKSKLKKAEKEVMEMKENPFVAALRLFEK